MISVISSSHLDLASRFPERPRLHASPAEGWGYPILFLLPGPPPGGGYVLKMPPPEECRR